MKHDRQSDDQSIGRMEECGDTQTLHLVNHRLEGRIRQIVAQRLRRGPNRTSSPALNQQPSQFSSTARERMRAVPAASVPAQGDLAAEQNDVMLTHLISYEHMGKAKVDCISGCT